MKYFCSVYTHQISLEYLKELLPQTFPKADIVTYEQKDSKAISVTLKAGLFSGARKFVLEYSQRLAPSVSMDEVSSSFSKKLLDIKDSIGVVHTDNYRVKDQLLQKFNTVNSEVSIYSPLSLRKKLSPIIKKMAAQLDGIVKMEPLTPLSQTYGKHFLDSNMNLILDKNGRTEIKNLGIVVQAEFFNKPIPSIQLSGKTEDSTGKIISTRGVI